MFIRYKNDISCITTLPGQEKQLIQFLEKSGFEPSEVYLDQGRKCIKVTKEFNLYAWDPKWEDFIGYTPILTKLLRRFRN